ncbi:PLP-dependent aminotransferase family protein [Brevibacterium samyangense]|uniref:HTH gntR-type domain-containing protein n=1 Tax=Brevibacterium samyangense TaxID=366888 RepID=A0ABP5EME5_9MICO
MSLRDLHLDLDRDAVLPLPAQIAAAVRAAVRAGTLVPGDRLPGSRTLADHLGLARGTVETAYEQLRTEGYLVSRPRGGTYLDPDLPASALRALPDPGHVAPARTGPPVRIDLRPGAGSRPITAESRFRAAWRAALDLPSDTADPNGIPRLRWAISEHLRLMRGITVDPDHILVTGGSRDGLALALRALASPAQTLTVAVEDPGFPGLRRTLDEVTVLPVPVDEHGMSVEALDALAAAGERISALLLTPNHQFPHGTTMPAGRRAALLAWARTHGTVVLEDDYDSEARYAGPLVPPMWESAPDTVVHIGTFSTVLTREVSTGYVVATGHLGARMRRLRAASGAATPLLVQKAVAEYLASGGLRARIARGRRRMRAAERVAAGFRDLPGLVEAGRSLVVEMPAERARAVRAALAESGVRVGDLSEGWSGRARRHGIVIAHPAAEPAELRTVLERLRALLTG